MGHDRCGVHRAEHRLWEMEMKTLLPHAVRYLCCMCLLTFSHGHIGICTNNDVTKRAPVACAPCPAGDKIGTAISIAYSCRLFSQGMPLVILKEQDFEEAVHRAAGGACVNVGVCVYFAYAWACRSWP